MQPDDHACAGAASPADARPIPATKSPSGPPPHGPSPHGPSPESDPTQEPLAEVTVTVSGDTVSAVISGELDMSNALDIAASLLVACDRTRALVLDLTAVTFLDSHGISALYRLHEEQASVERPLRVIAGTSSPVGRTLQLAGLDLMLTIEEPDQDHPQPKPWRPLGG